MSDGDTQVPEGFTQINLGNGFASHVGPFYFNNDWENPSVGFRVLDHHCNPVGICHGGMMMTLMDMVVGMAVAAAKAAADGKMDMVFTPTINMTYDFLSPAPKGAWLQSRVEFADAKRKIGFGNAYLDGPDGPVLRANGMVKIPSATNPQFQYQEDEPFSS